MHIEKSTGTQASSTGPSTGPPRLTVALIVRDAADLIAATLQCVQPIADQIVVVDTGSTDGTQGIAKTFGASVIEHAWTDDFSAARNCGWDHATGDWVLWLDAGEQLTPQAAAELRSFVQTQADPSKAYMLLVIVPAADDHISGEQIGRIRLLPNRPDVRFTGRVRESVRPSLERTGLEVEGLHWRIWRTARDHDPAVKLARAQRDIHLVGLEIEEHGQRSVLLVALGDALANLGDRTSAAACFRKALQAASPGSTLMREAYYGLLTAHEADESRRESRLAVCVEALEIFPLDPQLLCAMGGYLQIQGDLELAGRAYRTAFQHGQIDPQAWHVPDIRDIAAVCFSLTCQQRNSDAEAREVLEEALRQDASSSRVRRHLIELHVKHDRRKEALAEFDKLPAETPNREALRSAIRGACLASKQNWAPALAYLQTAYSAGCRDLLCLRWLAATLFSTGDQAAALPILLEWQRREPRSTELGKYLEALDAKPARVAPRASQPAPLNVPPLFPTAPLPEIRLGGRSPAASAATLPVAR